MTEITTVVFDFDGTLADSFDVILGVADELFEIDQDFSAEFMDELRSMHKAEVLDALDISKFKALMYYRQGKQRLEERSEDITLFDGVVNALDEISDEYTVGILTDNEVSIVEEVLGSYDVPSFAFVRENQPWRSKQHSLSSIIKDWSDDGGNDVVYIGDQVTDVEAAHRAGCEAIAVTWGYNDESYLETYHADRVVDSPDALVDAVQSL